MRPLDEIDLRILDLLARESRLSMSDVSDRLKLARQTVHRRMMLLHKSGHIRSGAKIDYAKLGLGITAVMMVKLKSLDAKDRITKELKAIPNLRRVIFLFGQYDMLVEAIAATNAEVLEIAKQVANSTDGDVTTFLAAEDFELIPSVVPRKTGQMRS